MSSAAQISLLKVFLPLSSGETTVEADLPRFVAWFPSSHPCQAIYKFLLYEEFLAGSHQLYKSQLYHLRKRLNGKTKLLAAFSSQTDCATDGPKVSEND